MIDLAIPAPALRELSRCVGYGQEPENLCVYAVAAPVVAAELRRLAEALEFPPDRVKLIFRADELDPPEDT